MSQKYGIKIKILRKTLITNLGTCQVNGVGKCCAKYFLV